MARKDRLPVNDNYLLFLKLIREFLKRILKVLYGRNLLIGNFKTIFLTIK